MVSRDSERVEVLDVDESGSLINISATGAAFLSTVPMENGRKVVLSVNDAAFECDVVYCHQRSDGFRVGVHFTTADIDQNLRLGRMVELFSCGVPLQVRVSGVL